MFYKNAKIKQKIDHYNNIIKGYEIREPEPVSFSSNEVSSSIDKEYLDVVFTEFIFFVLFISFNIVSSMCEII